MSTPSAKTRGPRTVFEEQREELVREIANGMEEVLANINRLSRNLDSVIAVGNEFGSVEALWTQFETFMGRSQEEVEGNVRLKDEQDEGQSELHQ
ncbi:DASH complex subunit Dad1-domain-containing protein [Aspergillus falconensis]